MVLFFSEIQCSFRCKIYRKSPLLESFFWLSYRLKICKFIKKRLRHGRFPVYFAKLKNIFFTEHIRATTSTLHRIGFFITLKVLLTSVQLAVQVIVGGLPCSFSRKCHQLCQRLFKTREAIKFLVKLKRTTLQRHIKQFKTVRNLSVTYDGLFVGEILTKSSITYVRQSSKCAFGILRNSCSENHHYWKPI